MQDTWGGKAIHAALRMSASGQSRRFAPPPMTSGLPPEADTVTAGRHVSKVPIAEILKLGFGTFKSS